MNFDINDHHSINPYQSPGYFSLLKKKTIKILFHTLFVDTFSATTFLSF